VLLHVLGMLYMFVGLAIVCDELFCVALEVMSEVLGISDDVAGATLMAAGGSMPELFTSLIGTLVAPSDVGIGTVVGSACFNVLFVIGMCAMFSRELLKLTWWPLFRDVSFYVVDLVILAVCFIDGKIEWFEALILLVMYAAYVTFMKFNQKVEHWVKSKIVARLTRKGRAEGTIGADGDTSKLTGIAADMARSLDQPHGKVNVQSFRLGALSLMLGNVDARGRGPRAEKESRFSRAVEIVLADKARAKSREAGAGASAAPAASTTGAGSSAANDPPGTATSAAKDGTESGGTAAGKGGTESGAAAAVKGGTESEPAKRAGTSTSVADGTAVEEMPDDSSVDNAPGGDTPNGDTAPRKLPNLMLAAAAREREKSGDLESGGGGDGTGNNEGNADDDNDDDDDDDEGDAFALQWPATNGARVVFILLFPITFMLWLTVPNCALPNKRKYWLATFLMSLLWITIFSFLMVFFATVLGLAAKIPIAVMGLTLIAAGTSVPDLISSVVVARKGLGDMAVSSSIGSNIFDITFGLPVPWLIFAAINQGKPVVVQSDAIGLLVLLLLLMLIAVIVAIAASGWAMTKTLGVTMFALYGVFLTVALLLEFDVVSGF
jgi:sodium/potassium/calcium exchanger 1